LLINLTYGPGSAEAREVQASAHSIGLQMRIFDASTATQIDAAFASIVEQRIDALIVGTDPFLLGQRDQVVGLALRHRVPTIYFTREFVDVGGLVSYGPSITNGYRQAGTYVARILIGESPGDLPVLQPTHFVLFINLKTAKALDIELPPTVLPFVDYVIE